MDTMRALLLWVLVCSSVQWNIPGMIPRDYAPEDRIYVFASKLYSTKTQLPYEYYSLPFCRPSVIKTAHENIGQVLSGDKVVSTQYILSKSDEAGCHVACQSSLKINDVTKLRQFIADDYQIYFLFDDLPVSYRTVIDGVNNNRLIKRGVPIGFHLDDVYYLYNHFDFRVRYNPIGDKIRIISAEVVPSSLIHKAAAGDSIATCEASTVISSLVHGLSLNEKDQFYVGWTYTSSWEEELNVNWASRWDVYLQNAPNRSMRLLTVSNSILIGFFLTLIIAFILARTVYKDIARYNEYLPLIESHEEVEESGWKLVHGDVFRPPMHFRLFLATLVGSGVQILVMTLIVIGFMCLGVLSPQVRGSLLTAALFIFVLLGSLSGYYAARVYKHFKGKNWKTLTLSTSLFFPGCLFLATLFINLWTWSAGSTLSIPFLSVFYLLLMWFGISAPLVFLGAYLGFKRDEYSLPCKTTQIPRPIPPQPWYLHYMIAAIISGLIPFSSIYLELQFVMNTFWMQHIFTVFGLLFLVFSLSLLAIAEISIVFCYMQLVYENHSWCWQCIMNSSSLSFFIMIYSIFYSSRLMMSSLSTYIVYYGTMLIACFIVGVLSSSVAFFSCFWFIRKIYSSIKVD